MYIDFVFLEAQSKLRSHRASEFAKQNPTLHLYAGLRGTFDFRSCQKHRKFVRLHRFQKVMILNHFTMLFMEHARRSSALEAVNMPKFSSSQTATQNFTTTIPLTQSVTTARWKLAVFRLMHRMRRSSTGRSIGSSNSNTIELV